MTTTQDSAAGTKTISKGQLWAGRVVSGLPVVGLLLSGVMKLTHNPQIVQNFDHLGYSATVITGIGVTEIVCAILYAIPQTTLFGAVLVTAYLGGAVASHVRIGEGFVPVVVLGVLVWIGLWLREPRLRAITPLRKPE